VPGNRASRPPPPIPGAAPPIPSQARPPPPPPPGAPSWDSTTDEYGTLPSRPPPPRPHEESEEEVTEYEGDYDTDIASSVPHKDALKASAHESSFEDLTPTRSPISPAANASPSVPPPIPSASPPRAVPPPVPSQPPPPPMPDKRQSVDAPRAAPPPPPPAKEPEEFDQYSYATPQPSSGYHHATPAVDDGSYFGESSRAAPSAPPPTRPPPKQSLDVQRGAGRRSADVGRPSLDSSFIADDVDLAIQSGWYKQSNQVPPVLQGRKDVYYESEESTTTNRGAKTVVTRTIYVLYMDYSQTILTVRFDPYDASDVEIGQRHEPPPRHLRQDQLEQSYERFGRAIYDVVSSKKDTVVGDGTSHGLIYELLRPFRDALRPVGTRAYGALVYANMANASTQQNDQIRPGDIISIRNARFQGKHGAMHAKYSMEVGKPDHVAVVAEWDGTKKKVRAWEQGRESKKVKLESFKLDDLRSGEVKIWRVMPRSWVGWSTKP
jgi:myosin tail region-interacting protein MTI1